MLNQNVQLSTIEPAKTIRNVPRRVRINNLYKYLDGSIYDYLQYGFDEETSQANSYIPLRRRRPSIVYRLPKIIVDNSVSLVFGESKFPKMLCEGNAKIEEELQDLAKHVHLKETMAQIATLGSVGSVAVLIKFVNHTVQIVPMKTDCLIPLFDDCDSSTLIKVRSVQCVPAENLIARGYQGLDKKKNYYLVREWNANEEIEFMPILADNVKDENEMPLEVNPARCAYHKLGCVPILWIRNLGSLPNDIDGECTFEAAITESIEIDYQLSQVGRGLKYSSDPVLLVKRGKHFIADIDVSTNVQMPVTQADFEQSQKGAIVKSAANAFEVDSEGDAKLLEISGEAAKTVLEYVAHLRKYALEAVHGNRADPEKIKFGQSGKAIELLNEPLIWLAERLQYSYGSYGLQKILKMIILGSKHYPIIIKGKRWGVPEDTDITLEWSSWNNESAADKHQKASTVKIYKDTGIISQKTATAAVAKDFHIEDVDAEIAEIKQEQAEFQAQAQPQAKEVLNL